MTAFFMLSGFALYTSYSDKNLLDFRTNGEQIKTFYVNRALSVLPIYYSVTFIWTILFDTEPILNKIITVPLEIFCLQAFFPYSHMVSHNAGSWFVSCIVFCYFFYPLIQELFKSINKKIVIVIMLCSLVMIYFSSLWVGLLGFYSVYSNPLYRGLQFVLGVALANLINERRFPAILHSGKLFVVEIGLLIIGITAGMRLHLFNGNLIVYDWVVIPVFILLFVTGMGYNNPMLEKSKILKELCNIYEFWLVSLLTWSIPIKCGIETLSGGSNTARIAISFCVNSILAITFHEFIGEKIFKIKKDIFCQRIMI